jgi:hypothetical protein
MVLHVTSPDEARRLQVENVSFKRQLSSSADKLRISSSVILAYELDPHLNAHQRKPSPKPRFATAVKSLAVRAVV